MSVVHSRLLYGSQVWADEVNETNKARALMIQPQRQAALRVARCYRSVSDLVSLLLARMPPAYLLARERSRMSVMKKSGAKVSRLEVREDTVRQWQTVWEAETKKAAWSKRLIPDVCRWWRSGPRAISFHMAQVISGHGCFQKFLWSRARALSPACVHCMAPVDDAEHTIFSCAFWDADRAKLVEALGRSIKPEDVAELLYGPDAADIPVDRQSRDRITAHAVQMREVFMRMVEDIMGRKEELESERQNAI